MKGFVVGAQIFLAVLAGTAQTQRDPSSAPIHGNDAGSTSAHRITAKGLPNFAEVTPKLYRGGQPSDTGLQALARMGVGIVVDARPGTRKREREEVSKLGMQYVAIPWHCPLPKDSVFAHFLAVIRENPDKKVFVHCRLGDDRTGMMIAAYRMGEQGWSAEAAMQEMRASGFSTAHHFICPRLAGYEKDFPRRYKTNSEFRSVR